MFGFHAKLVPHAVVSTFVVLERVGLRSRSGRRMCLTREMLCCHVHRTFDRTVDDDRLVPLEVSWA